MKTYSYSANKSVFPFFLLLVFIIALLPLVCGKSPTFIPTTPVGPTIGYVNIDYDYFIVTMNQNSSWMFDWGDGTTTPWLQLTDGQTTIAQIHHWITAGTYQLRAKFKNDQIADVVWSNPLTVTISAYTNENIPSTPIIRSGTMQGFQDRLYTYSAVATDPQNYQVCYRFDWGNNTLSEWTDLVPSGTFSIFSYTWIKSADYSVKAQARNQYGLESAWSEPILVTMKSTSTDDGSSVDLIVLNNCSHRIVYTSSRNGTFYNSSTGLSSAIQWNGGGEFFIDDDSDGYWDYLYAPLLGEIQPIQQQVMPDTNILVEVPWLLLLIIVSIIIGIITVVFVLVKIGFIYVY